MVETIRHEARIPDTLSGRRLDRAVAALFPEYSRSRLQRWIRDGRVTVDGGVRRPRDPVREGEVVALEAEPETETFLAPQEIPLEILYEDEALLVLDKPPGLVVHPGAGNPDGTLVNALLHYDPDLSVLPRAGVVHRLDKETSGVLVVARTLAAHAALVDQLQRRVVGREYQALVVGRPTAGGKVEGAIGRHPTDRKRMAVVERGRAAVTHYRVAERFSAHTLLNVWLETGRTHQIRVHMAYAGFPLVGDPVYGRRLVFPKGAGEGVRQALSGFRRQALHARRLTLVHPVSGDEMSWETPLPADMAALLEVLRGG